MMEEVNFSICLKDKKRIYNYAEKGVDRKRFY